MLNCIIGLQRAAYCSGTINANVMKINLGHEEEAHTVELNKPLNCLHHLKNEAKSPV